MMFLMLFLCYFFSVKAKVQLFFIRMSIELKKCICILNTDVYASIIKLNYQPNNNSDSTSRELFSFFSQLQAIKETYPARQEIPTVCTVF